MLGVLGGTHVLPARLALWTGAADLIVAADSGADHVLAAGAVPDVLIGDLDSVSEHAKSRARQVVHDQDSYTTDCDKLLRHLSEAGHRDAVLAGVEGDRLDHTLATLSSLVQSGLDLKLILQQGTGFLVREGTAIEALTVPGSVVSLLPLRPSEGVSLSGVQWPLDRERLAVGERISISNVATGSLVLAEVREGAALLIVDVPEEHLPIW